MAYRWAPRGAVNASLLLSQKTRSEEAKYEDACSRRGGSDHTDGTGLQLEPNGTVEDATDETDISTGGADAGRCGGHEPNGALRAGGVIDTSPATTDDRVRQYDATAQRELVREVAASLKSLAKVLPYAEYADIVHRIAELRWRCEATVQADARADRA